jgi:thiamine-monophosphate kinase
MGELSLIAKFRASAPGHPWLLAGPGHDCAVLRWNARRDLAYKIDQVVEGTHFVLSGSGAASPRQVGWKALAKACSDIAAAGCWHVAAAVAINLQKGSDEKLALEIYKGICDCCRRFSFALAGGDMAVSRNKLSLVVSMLGEGPRSGAWLRRGARPGDDLLVTGTLGGSLTGKHLAFTPRLKEARRMRQIIPKGVHACIDITDGLSRDLHHLCSESRCGAVIFQEQLPFSRAALSIQKRTGRSALAQVLSDGEDFELLLAVEPHAAVKLFKEWDLPVPLTHIGVIQPLKKSCVLIDRAGNACSLRDVGYEHNT